MATGVGRFKGWHCAARVGQRQRASAAQQTVDLLAQGLIVGGRRGWFGNEDQIKALYRSALLPEAFAQLALDAVTTRGLFVYPLGNSNAQAGGSACLDIGQDVHAQTWRGETLTGGKHGLKLGRCAQTRPAWETGRAIANHDVWPPAAGGGRRCAGNARASDAEAGTALGATTGKNLAPICGFHARTETVIALTLEVAGLVGALGGHGDDSIEIGAEKTANYTDSTKGTSSRARLASSRGGARLPATLTYPQPQPRAWRCCRDFPDGFCVAALPGTPGSRIAG